MFDILKKLDEEQKNGEQNIAETRENIEENNKEENKSEKMNTQEPLEKTEADILSTLEKVEGEEQLLLAEKSQLLKMEEKLRQRIKDEIEIKRHRIENLKYEIPELKQRCEALAKVLDIPVKK